MVRSLEFQGAAELQPPHGERYLVLLSSELFSWLIFTVSSREALGQINVSDDGCEVQTHLQGWYDWAKVPGSRSEGR